MMSPTRRCPASFLSAATCALLAACTTQEIGALRAERMQTSPDQAGLLIISAATPDSVPTRLMKAQDYDTVGGRYVVLIDGRRLVFNDNNWPLVTTIDEGSATSIGFLPAGPHRFVIAMEGGGPIVFTGDVPMPAGAVTRLYLFGPREALQSRIVSYPFEPLAGRRHVHFANLVLDDTRFQLLSCVDATRCTPISEPLATGDTFDDYVPLTGSEEDLGSLDATGAGIGFRQIATSAVPAPFVMALSRDHWPSPPDTDAGTPAVSVALAPMFLAADGSVLIVTN